MGVPEMPNNSITPVIVPIVLIVIAVIIVLQTNKNFDYQCSNCGAIFSLSALSALFSLHMMGKKFVRCPHCGAVTWANRIPKSWSLYYNKGAAL